MKCPACLSFNVETDAVSVVSGTEYCAQHAVDALRLATVDPRTMRGPMRGGPANMAVMTQFTPPPQALAPEAPSTDTPTG